MKEFYTTLRGILSCVTLKPAPGHTLCAHTRIPTAVIHPFTHTCLSVQTHCALLQDNVKKAYLHTRKEVSPQSYGELTHSHTKRCSLGATYSLSICVNTLNWRGACLFLCIYVPTAGLAPLLLPILSLLYSLTISPVLTSSAFTCFGGNMMSQPVFFFCFHSFM